MAWPCACRPHSGIAAHFVPIRLAILVGGSGLHRNPTCKSVHYSYNGYNYPITSYGMNMKVMTARDAKNHFGEFLHSAQREPIVITKNDRPVGIMISMEDAEASLLPEMMNAKEAGHEQWVVDKVTETMRRVDSGETLLLSHDDAMGQLRARINSRISKIPR